MDQPPAFISESTHSTVPEPALTDANDSLSFSLPSTTPSVLGSLGQPPSDSATLVSTVDHNTIDTNDPLATYQEELQNVLEYVDQGMILKSFSLLGQLTEKLVANIEPLGLTTDENPSPNREGLWTGLNNCWLFAFSHYQNARSDDQTLQEHHLHHLRSRVVEWANRLEPWGLVDYELGFWERDILEAIDSCLINSPTASSPGSPLSQSATDSTALLGSILGVLDQEQVQGLDDGGGEVEDEQL